jgi:hypothetical protein
MKTSRYGWLGKTVRNQDGRTGTITAENPWGPWCELTITAEDGSIAKITLCANSADIGDAGWQWWCPEFSHGSAWLPLGDKGAPISVEQP